MVDELSSWLKKVVEASESATIVGLPGSNKKNCLINSFEKLGMADKYEMVDMLANEEEIGFLRNEKTEYVVFNHVNFGDISHLRFIDLANSARNKTKKRINFIFVSQQEPSLYAQIINQYHFSKLVFGNIFLIPYTDKKDFVEHRLGENEKRSGVKPNKAEVEWVWEMSGGCLFLIKHLVKNIESLRKNKMIIDDKLGLVIKGFVNSFDLKYLKFLKEESKDSEVEIVLKNLRLIDERGIVKSSLIKDLVKEIKISSKLTIEEDRIKLRNIDITSKFVPKEVEFLTKIAQEKKMSREEVGKICFNEDDQYSYSEYAIDQFVSRLRKKLKKVGAGSEVILTQKKIGFVYNPNE